ncbi:hypothetical protein ACFFTM_15165 [Pseudoduganella plicata]|uniref:DUF998 domain-containing protein n=1 Tax=Pseudoduganella plicata TaxID=321984 RepID=A0A4P7B8H8_9BURK|nr:hypothetical protein [Pseudoduganella plicata]QBQ34761.1 hypothetical protein E1742_00085 [Pseudoduganella plicata]GGY88272.1 hypothetical protein GCM10007388_22120 [Pseudoduganella plicata]
MDIDEKACAVSYLTLQKMIGWAGLLMPVAVRGGGLLCEGIRTTDSLSAYYYTGMRDIFVATTVLTGALLACYRSSHAIDNIVATIAGIAAIGLALFPMDPTYAAELLARYPDLGTERHYSNHGVLGYHLFFAITFAALSFYLVYFRFGAQTPHTSPHARRRRQLYKACGGIMLLSYAAIAVLAVAARGASLFWPETCAVVAFAVAWLVKGARLSAPGGTADAGAPSAAGARQ